jgi:hypothetical protein
MSVIVIASLAIWVGGIRLQWWLRMKDLPQTIAMLLVLALPVWVTPALARWSVAFVRPDAALLSRHAGIWLGVLLLALWALLSALLFLGVAERVVAGVALPALCIAALLATYSEATPPSDTRVEAASQVGAAER